MPISEIQRKWGLIVGCLAICGSETVSAQMFGTSNLMPDGNMIGFSEQPNPWGGVDSSGCLRGTQANQLAVDNDGNIGNLAMSPSVAVGDLNGDGLPDLVLADPKGFFWYYQNSGSKSQPKFTTGEIMPIWLGSPVISDEEANGLSDIERNGRVLADLVPRIQLVDLQGTGKLDLVVGTFPGKLFYLQNRGTPSQPKFDTPRDLSNLRPIPTTVGGKLDCNFFSPFFYEWLGKGLFDLIRGDGTYSANSIYLYPNKGTNDQPLFTETTRVQIIPGMGREHLTPQVVDWNNDGKPDILTGEREGYIDLFLNRSDDRAHPDFDLGQHLKFGGRDKFGQFTTVTAAALSGNPQAPDILITNDTGQLIFCHNTGAAGRPVFTSVPESLKGINPFPKILVSNSWALGPWNRFAPYALHGWSEGPPYGVPYQLLVVTNASQEPGFAPPSGSTWKNALKYEELGHSSRYFGTSFYPMTTGDADKHQISYTQPVRVESESRYQLSFWIKSEGVQNLSYKFYGGQESNPDAHDGVLNWVTISNPVNADSTWTNVKDTVSWSTTTEKSHDSVDFQFEVNFYGQGTLYIADVQLRKI